MPELLLEGLNNNAASRVLSFFENIISGNRNLIHSLYVTGSALTDDYVPKKSDVNSVIVLKQMDLAFLESLAPMGKKLRRAGVAAPLIMTPEYISTSLDVFPIEFLSFKLCHHFAYGEEDLFANVELKSLDLRHQCERELKVKLISLRQGYLSTMGDAKVLRASFAGTITSFIPLFRGIIHLTGGTPPLLYDDVIKTLSGVTGVDCGVYLKALAIKRGGKADKAKLDTLFENYYTATEKLCEYVDQIN